MSKNDSVQALSDKSNDGSSVSFFKALGDFISGLLDRNFKIPRESLNTWWPAFGAFFWFLYMGLFSASTLLLYSQTHETGGTGYFFSGFIVLNIGIFFAMYLATLGDGSRGQEANQNHPFTLSLHACYIESLGVVAALMWTIGRHMIDTCPSLESIISWGNKTESDSYLVGLLSFFWDNATSLGVWAVLVALALAALLVAHQGFRLIGRRHDLTKIFQGNIINAGDPPISSKPLKEQIAHLESLRKELLKKAEREDTFADACEKRIELLSRQIEEIERRIAALKEERQALEEDRTAYEQVHEAAKALQVSFEQKTHDIARKISKLFHAKIAALLGMANGQFESGNDLFKEEIGKLEKRLAEDRTEIERLSREIDEEKKKSEYHRQEAARLKAEAEELERRIAELEELAKKIDDTNAEWTTPYRWEATVHGDKFVLAHTIPAGTYSGALESDSVEIDKIKKGTFVLFLYATLLLVVNDFLTEAPWTWPKTELLSESIWKGALYFFGIIALLWVMKSISLISFMGSWRTIMASNDPDKPIANEYNQDSGHKKIFEPRFNDTLKVVGANAAGSAAFAILFAICLYYISSEASRLCVDKGKACVAIWNGIDLVPLLSAIKQLYVMPFLGFAAGLAIATPFAVYLIEKQRRKPNGLAQLRMFGIVIFTIFGTMTAGGLGALIGEIVSGFVPPSPPPPPPISKETQTQMACPLQTIKLDGNTTVATWNAQWLFGDNVKIAGAPENLKETACKIHVGKYGVMKDENGHNVPAFDAKYIAIIGAESQEHYIGKVDGGLSKERVNTIVNSFIASSDLTGQADGDKTKPEIGVYVWPLGLSNNTCKGCTYDQTAYQRPAFIIIGNETDETAIQNHLRKATEGMLSKAGRAPSGASATLEDYPKAGKPQKWKRCTDGTYQPTCSAPAPKH